MQSLLVDFRAAGKVLSVLPEKEKTVGDFDALLKQALASTAEEAPATDAPATDLAGDPSTADGAQVDAPDEQVQACPGDPTHQASEDEGEEADSADAEDKRHKHSCADGHAAEVGRAFGLSHHPLLALFDLAPEDFAGAGLKLGELRGNAGAFPEEVGGISPEIAARLREMLSQASLGAFSGKGPNGQALIGILQGQGGPQLAVLALDKLPQDLLAKLQALAAAGAAGDAPDLAAAQASATQPAAENSLLAQLVQRLRDQGVRFDLANFKESAPAPISGSALFTASQIASAEFGANQGGGQSNTNSGGQGSALGFAQPSITAPSLMPAGADFQGNLFALMGPDGGLVLAPRGMAQPAMLGQPGGPAGHVAPELVANQVAVQIQRAQQEGLDRIRISLSPEDLGRVDVRLELRHDGRLLALIGAERPETLDLLQRDARVLERALQEAGFKTDPQSFSFDLGFAKGEQHARFAKDFDGGKNRETQPAAASALAQKTLSELTRPHHAGALDIQV